MKSLVGLNTTTTSSAKLIDLNLYDNIEIDDHLIFDRSSAERDDDGGFETDNNVNFDSYYKDF